jgi:hypothetical protein
MAFGGDEKLLLDYLNGALEPALRRIGITDFQLFREYGAESPAKLHALMAYNSPDAYYRSHDLSQDDEYQVMIEPYVNPGGERPVFTRYSSWLLRAFSGMPTLAAIPESSGLFELRTYESANEDQLKRKTRMFNDHEFGIFDEVGLDPIFFGTMIAGPHRPALVYLLEFEDMAERDANWAKFGPHPEWQRIKDLPEFKGTVSNIRRTFLVPA